MKKINVYSLINARNWKGLMRECRPEFVVGSHSFVESMRIADEIVMWDHRSDHVINYAVKMFIACRERFQAEWNADWKNDLFLADLCEVVLRYDEVLHSCRRAYELQLPDPPALVLFSYGNCYFLPPEVETISQEESIELFKKAAEKELTFETASLLRDLYKDRNDNVNAKYWDTMAKEAESRKLHNAIIVPDVFKEDEQ